MSGRHDSARVLWIAGVTTFLATLLVTAPAGLLAPAVQSLGGGSGYGGTIWRGQVRRAWIAGVDLGRLRWQLHPSALWRGRLAADVEADLPGGFARGTVAVPLAGGVLLSGVVLSAPVAALSTAGGPYTAASQVSAELQQLEWRKTGPTALVGTLRLSGVTLAVPDGSPGAASTGQFIVRFDAPRAAEDGSLAGTLADEGGPLEVSGTITLGAPATWAVSGLIRARAGTPASLASMLSTLGPRDAEGRHAFTIEGSF